MKAIDREHRDADALAAVGRYLAFRHVEDETPFATSKQRVEHEALLASLAAHAGVHAALPLAIASRARGPERARARADRRPLDRRGRTAPALDDATRRRAVEGGRRTCAPARIAHRHLSLHNVMLDAAGSAVDRRLRLRARSARAIGRWRRTWRSCSRRSRWSSGRSARSTPRSRRSGKPAVTEALPLMQPLALATRTRHALRHHHGLLDEVRNGAADAVGAEHVKLEPLTRVRAPIAPDARRACSSRRTCSCRRSASSTRPSNAARHAELGLARARAARRRVGTFLAAALSLSGAVLAPLAYGRTFVTQLASSFGNKITPAGLGGLGINVRYLERSGCTKGDAVGAVALNGTVGFVVHVVALIVERGAARPHRPAAVHLPNGWVLLVLVAVVLLGRSASSSRRRSAASTSLLPTERTGRDLLAVVRVPTKAAQMFGGAILVLVSYIVALGSLAHGVPRARVVARRDHRLPRRVARSRRPRRRRARSARWRRR